MATLVSDLIVQSFVDLAYIRPGATITNTMQAAAFLILQQMMSNWSAEQVMAYVVYHQAFTVTAGTSIYTVGTGGTLVSTARPVRITAWKSVLGNFRNGGPILSFDAFHAQVKDPLGSGTLQLAQFVAADQAYPAINIEIYPIPAATPGTLTLDYYSPLPVFATVGDTVTLPDGWESALHFNLAIALAPQYARPSGVPEARAANAANAKQAIAQKNAAILNLQAAA